MATDTGFLNATQTVIDLTNAAHLLLEAKWVQGYDFDGQGGMCAFGAIRRAAGDDLITCSTQTRDRSSNAARAFYREYKQDIVAWNDAEGRTKTEVVAALLEVAALVDKDPTRA